MKFVIALLLSFTLASHAAETKTEPTGPRYRHIQDAEGKILATIDSKDGKIDYKEDPKQVVPVLIGIIDKLGDALNKASQPKQEKKPEKKK